MMEAARDFPVPSNTKQLKAFLGLAGYSRKFVRRFSPIAKPLHKLTGKMYLIFGDRSKKVLFRH
jgi:hypothetical protein